MSLYWDCIILRVQYSGLNKYHSLDSTQLDDRESEEISLNDYDTVSDLYLLYLLIERSVFQRRCGPCNLNNSHCEIQDQVISDGAYECIYCAEHEIRCWPPAGWALPLLYMRRYPQRIPRAGTVVSECIK